LGIGNRSFLSRELITLLNQRHVSTLAQASSARDLVTFAEVLRRSDDLELLGDRATEWTNFTSELCGVGITLIENRKDVLRWTGGDSSRELTVKNCYNVILSTQTLPTWSSWKVKLWKWSVQRKFLLFF
jgi:hypothetical protein